MALNKKPNWLSVYDDDSISALEKDIKRSVTLQIDALLTAQKAIYERKAMLLEVQEEIEYRHWLHMVELDREEDEDELKSNR